MTTNVNPGIFRQYDIRGVYNRDLTVEAARAVGAAYGVYMKSKRNPVVKSGKELINKVSVGRDVRLSSDALRDALIEGITSTGIDVVDIGVCPTPLQYFSVFHLNVDGGIMITGSHNPPEFNGFKITVGKETIYGDKIQEVKNIIENGQSNIKAEIGKVGHYDIIPHYIEHLKKLFKDSIKTPVKIVVDSGNGTAGCVAPKLLKELGCEVIELFSQPDGNFPNHHPDPTITDNMQDLIKTTKANNADFGFAYDGDADRLGVVDESGAIIWGDQLMIIFARDILNNRTEIEKKMFEKPTFVSEVKCSQIMYDEITRLGGNAIMWKAGHSMIKSKMKETGAVVAGEMSGHLFFADRYFGYDDAIYASCRVAEIFSKNKLRKPAIRFSDLLSGLPKSFTTPEIRIDCPDDKKFGVIDKLSEAIALKQENTPVVRDVIRVDGLRIVFDNGGWALIRASNTQPVLVLRFEAITEKWLAEIKGFVEDLLKTVALNI